MRITKKALNKFLQKWTKKYPFSLNRYEKYNMEDIKDIVSDNIVDDNRTLAETKPKTNHNYVGIEIECFSKLSHAEAQILAVEMGIDSWLNLGTDGSVEADWGSDFELRVLVRETQLKSSLDKLAKFLKKGKFGANQSCGLHVHLDMRNRSMLDAYDKLRKFQDLMFGMVSEDRQRDKHGYCAYVRDFNQNQRYVAINKNAYNEHRTLEIRLHQGTVDTKQIGNWINLLLKMVNSKSTPKDFKKKEQVLKWVSKNKNLKTYIKKTYQENWKLDVNHYDKNEHVFLPIEDEDRF